jgi:predicted metal-binding membrane protein
MLKIPLDISVLNHVNLLWVEVIALFVMAEKMVARGEWIARIGGIAMAIAGVALIARRS